MKQSFLNSTEPKNIAFCILGSAVFCFAANVFITPMGLYSGGFIGISQLLSLVLPLPLTRAQIQSLLFFVINVPLFLLCLKYMGRRFIRKSFVTVVAETVFLAIIPIPTTPILEDMLTNCVVAAIISAFGCILIYVSFGSGGGTDMLGMLLSKRFRFLSVGRVAILVNVVVYGISAIVFNLEIAVYSLLTCVAMNLLVDRLYIQNNSVSVNILSKHYSEISDMILTELNRDATIVECIGAYSAEEKKMVISIMSEYELRHLKRRITEIDPKAFVYINPHVTVLGNFEKRLSD